jgi:NADH dehydrogenase FAD-containing subunit
LEGALSIENARGAERELEKLSVKIIRKSKVVEITTTGTGQTEVALENNQIIVTDLFLPTYGLIPNTEFLLQELLNAKDELILNQWLGVKNTKNVWAVGDVGNLQRNGYLITTAQADHLARSLDQLLRGDKPLPYKVPTSGKEQ